MFLSTNLEMQQNNVAIPCSRKPHGSLYAAVDQNLNEICVFWSQQLLEDHFDMIGVKKLHRSCPVIVLSCFQRKILHAMINYNP